MEWMDLSVGHGDPLLIGRINGSPVLVRLNSPHMVMRPFVLDLTKRPGRVSGRGGFPTHANRWHSHSA